MVNPLAEGGHYFINETGQGGVFPFRRHAAVDPEGEFIIAQILDLAIITERR
jgi:hypothetical protein